MAPDDRTALVSAVLDTVSDSERVGLVQEQLVELPSEERGAMLSSVFGLMTKGERQDILGRLQRNMASGDDEGG